MRYNKDFIILNSILKNVLSKYDLNDLSAAERLLQNWREIVGQELAEYFIPKYLRGGILYLQTLKTAGTKELKSKQKNLLRLINSGQDHPPVKDVKFI
jgi:predicted nucleic acid-binding Zn ribbon protein